MNRKYNARRYWENRGRKYKDRRAPAELQQLVGRIRQLQPIGILEIGSGYGRVFSYVRSRGVLDQVGAVYTMCDFVDSMIDGCEQATEVRPDKWDGECLPYDDRAFDMVISFSVLLHVPAYALERIWAEHVRVSSRWVYVASMARHDGKLADHCFSHDYDRLFEGVRVVDISTFDGGDRAHWLIDVEGARCRGKQI